MPNKNYTEFEQIKIGLSSLLFAICAFFMLPVIWLFPSSNFSMSIVAKLEYYIQIYKEMEEQWDEEDKREKEM